MDLFSIEFELLYTNLLQLVIAFLLPMPIAWDREGEGRGAGLRTFPLVSVAACGFAIIGIGLVDNPDSHARIVQGIITGIGFIGGGAILKQDNDVSGVSTAAAIWATGAIGVAVALHRLEIAIAISVMTFITFKLIGRVKDEMDE